MIQFKNKLYRALFILYSIVSIASTVYLLYRPEDNSGDIRYEKTNDELKHIQEYLKQKDSNYQHTIDSLILQSDSLQAVISITDKRLDYSRSRVRDLSDQIEQYVSLYDSDTSLEKNSVAFDSLSDLSKQYITQSSIRDSLCDSEINTLKEVITNKEIAFSNCDSLLADYKSESDKLHLQAQELNLQLQKAEKKIKRSRNINRLLTGSTIILSGIFITTQFIQ
jgi:chromosome segregation ATPase